MDQVFVDIYNVVWKEVFPGVEVMPVDKFREVFTGDIKLPREYKSAFGGMGVYSLADYGYKRFITEEEARERTNKDNFLKSKVEISGLGDLIEKTLDVAAFRGSRALNSDVVKESDNIYSSSYIYNSAEIQSSQKMIFCSGNKACEYLIASRGNGESTFGIRLFDNGGVSNSFEVHWSGKSSNCYFCSDSYDLRDCMFCFHLVSKQYCIGNMQFEEAEYKAMKEKLLGEYFEQLPSGKFKGLADL
jgi:hypothetical protein